LDIFIKDDLLNVNNFAEEEEKNGKENKEREREIEKELIRR